jgi:hydrogenase nickel incorporation protein HypA/HybF
MSIAQSILEIVLEEGRKHGLESVKLIKLQVGEMAAVVPESLKFCFELIRENTIASQAVLEMETVPVVARCSSCGTVFEVENMVFVCVQCGEPVVEFISGRELNLLSIEGDTGGENGGN